MSFLPTFLNWQFAAAGALFATGPVIIHLLNRRRYRVLPWAAMDFVREAVQQSQRILRFRDLLLLILRTAAVLLFGCALAQPYFSSRNAEFRGDEPVHAVLLMDNSLSMGYQTTEGSLLDLAKQKSRDLIQQLPAGSLISIAPLCGSRFPTSLDPYRVPEHALEALERIEVTDRSISLAHAANEAKRICEAAPELAKRVVFFSDQQRTNWAGFQPNSSSETQVPPIQSVDVGFSSSPTEWENSWVADLRVQDGLVDVETAATIVAELRHRGATAREDVTVTLAVNGVDVGSKVVTLDPSESAREVTFEHLFDMFAPEPGQPVYVPIQVRLSPDRLAEDDGRYLVVPVVASLPVVFIDQVSAAEENPAKNRLGETRHVRTLLAPRRKGEELSRQLISVRHRRIDEVDQKTLADARLVVIAGIASPEDRVGLLREYVEQGGQIFIAAGAEFDAASWNQVAWQDGDGILPLPLRPEAVGELPEEARGVLQPFFLGFESLATHEYFQIAGLASSDLRDLYSEPVFFKAAAVDASAETLQAFRSQQQRREEERFAEWRAIREQNAKRKSGSTGGTPTDADGASEDAPDAASARNWIVWATPGQDAPWADMAFDADAPLEVFDRQRNALIERAVIGSLPNVLAQYSGNNLPFLVERRMGRGKVAFLSSGILSSWNTLPKTNAIVLLDRILRTMILNTLPQRNFPSQDQLSLPVAVDIRDVNLMLQRPGDESWASIESTFVTRERRGVSISHFLQRGIYRVAGFPAAGSQGAGPPSSGPQAVGEPADNASRKPVWEVAVSANGDSQESDLTPVSADEVEKASASQAVVWVGRDETVSLAGAHIRGQNLWWWLAMLVLVLLIAESVTIVSSAWRLRRKIGQVGAEGAS